MASSPSRRSRSGRRSPESSRATKASWLSRSRESDSQRTRESQRDRVWPGRRAHLGSGFHAAAKPLGSGALPDTHRQWSKGGNSIREKKQVIIEPDAIAEFADWLHKEKRAPHVEQGILPQQGEGPSDKVPHGKPQPGEKQDHRSWKPDQESDGPFPRKQRSPLRIGPERSRARNAAQRTLEGEDRSVHSTSRERGDSLRRCVELGLSLSCLRNIGE